MMKIWFITGTSKGFGRVWAEAALERGDKVAATARNLDSLRELNEKYGDNVLTLPSARTTCIARWGVAASVGSQLSGRGMDWNIEAGPMLNVVHDIAKPACRG